MKKVIIPAMICAALLFSSCNKKKESVPELTSGVNFENLDTTANPADDFYQYACGGWMKNHPLTAEYSRYGSFDELGENNKKQINDLITEIAKTEHEKGSDMQKVGDLYNLGMDENTIETQGVEPIRPELEAIQALGNVKNLPALLADMHKNGVNPLFGVFGEADPKNSTMTIAWMWQTGLGIGAREYYLEPDLQTIRDEYVKLLTQMFQISGYSALANAEGKEADLAKAVFDFETKLAAAFMSKEDLRNPEATYNIYTISDLQTLTPNIDMKVYLENMGLGALESVNVGQVEYFKAMDKAVSTTDLTTLKAYLAWNVINAAAPYLNKAMVDADFNFFGKVLSGKEENQPRWKRVVDVVNGSLGEVVGKLYVEKYFPASAKERMVKLVENVKVALNERINAGEWMQPETKEKAVAKLNTMRVKIGYPEEWRDYSNLSIEKDSYYANVLRARRFENDYQLAKIGKPVDPSEWLMTPQTVNAYYNPTTNEICFPAGILQPPFFDMNADDAVNYGAIGVVIGHEMTHGFDDQGRMYDKDGNMTNWWTSIDSANFAERTQVLVDHFNAIEVLPGTFANGVFTLGENIADNGGVNIAFQAMQKAIADGGIQGEMDGFTPEQRFFIAYANVWAGNIRDAEIIKRTKEDPHSLGKWRVNGTLPHITSFIEAFNIKEGDKMWIAPEKRARIW